VRPHHDPLTDTTFVVQTAHALDCSRDDALARAQRLLARCAVEELVVDLGVFLRSEPIDRPGETTDATRQRDARGIPEA